jgi:MoaA/NifB/PqqE/SkfB family radical SAM enzyme
MLEPPFPSKQMSVELSNICNHKCVFCPHSKITRDKRRIDESLLYRVLHEAYDLGMREIGLFILGEPFASNNLPLYIEKAKRIGYTYVYITTNGALATQSSLKAVFEAGLDSIKFSINAGSRKTYRVIHGADDYEKVIENAIWCQKYRQESKKKFNLLCSFVVTTETFPCAGAFKRDYSSVFDEIAFYMVLI